jgi:hypothetical protein
MTPQEYACRYLYVAGRERSNVGDQKIAVFSGACHAGGYGVQIGRGGGDPVISVDPKWRAVATRRECRRDVVPRTLQINRSPPNGARRGQACWSVPISSRGGGRNYFSELLIEVNLSLRFVPTPLTTAIMASAMPAAISPYSIAVAPDSSDKKFNKVRFNSASLELRVGNRSRAPE